MHAVYMKEYYVYILASGRNGTLYIGVTNDLISRVSQHKSAQIEGFTKRYKIDMLVYYENCSDIDVAIGREKQLKAWHRAWKIRIIEEFNPAWRDLYDDILQS
jgi:putative endonuclease